MPGFFVYISKCSGEILFTILDISFELFAKIEIPNFPRLDDAIFFFGKKKPPPGGGGFDPELVAKFQPETNGFKILNPLVSAL